MFVRRVILMTAPGPTRTLSDVHFCAAVKARADIKRSTSGRQTEDFRAPAGWPEPTWFANDEYCGSWAICDISGRNDPGQCCPLLWAEGT